MKPAHVDVLIVNYLTGPLAVEAARSASGPGRHVFVLDNSGDVPASALEGLGGHLTVSPVNSMYAAGNNAVFGLCDGPYVLLLNPDVVCAPESVALLVDCLERNPTAWGAVPRLRNEDGSDQAYYRRLPTLASMLCDRVPPLRQVLCRAWSRHLYADLDPAVAQPVEGPAGACLLLRRSRVGSRLFDESFPLFFNDTQLSERMSHEAGDCLLVPHAEVVHLRGESLARERRTRQWAISRTYDESARLYARRYVRGWPLVWAVCTARLVLVGLLERRDRRRGVRA